MEPFIDLYLISGFLGAGKTTFLQQLVKNFKDKKVGIIVNEFGVLSIDGIVMKQNGIRLVEINNGSIFCSCLKSNFVNTLISFKKQPIDVLIIENSGLADPSNMKLLLAEMKNDTGRPYNYRGSICLVDPVNFLKHVKILTPVQNQVITSNLVVINKTDLAKNSTIKAVESKIIELNPEANIYKTSYGNVPVEILEQKITDIGYYGQTSNNVFNRPATYTLESDGVFSKEGILEFIKNIKPYAFRIKGFLKADSVSQEPVWWKIDTVEDLVNIEEITLADGNIQEISKLVIIGKEQKEFINQVEAVWKDLFKSEIYVYV